MFLLQNKHPRGDYRDLLELCVIILGGQVKGKAQYNFKKPGALSKTRWMARAINALKTWMFGRQIELTAQKDSELLALCIFICRAYVKHWFTSPNATEAPRSDLEFLKFLYANRRPEWDAAFQKLLRHLWYLCPKLVLLALFDMKVSCEEKCDMVAALRRGKCSAKEVMRAEVTPSKVPQLKLSHFVSKDSMKFFSFTRIDKSFLSKHPSLWPKDVGFQKGQKFVSGIKVVND